MRILSPVTKGYTVYHAELMVELKAVVWIDREAKNYLHCPCAEKTGVQIFLNICDALPTQAREIRLVDKLFIINPIPDPEKKIDEKLLRPTPVGA